jgi:hypothetical protein
MSKTYLYRMFDRDDTLLYVGISKSVLTRLGQHMTDKEWLPSQGYIRWLTYPSRETAEAAEKKAIIREKPQWNVIYSERSTNQDLQNYSMFPEKLAKECIRQDFRIRHYGKCRMLSGGSKPCKWEDVVVLHGFCCRFSFDQYFFEKKDNEYYRAIMTSYLDAYLQIDADRDIVIPLLGEWPQQMLLKCGKH